jgi:hypothetical protein
VSSSNTWNNVLNPQVSASLFSSSFSNNSLNFTGTGSFANLTPTQISGSFTLSFILNSRTAPSSSFAGRDALIAQNSSSFEMRGIELSSTSSLTFRNLGTYMSEDYPLATLSTNQFYHITIARNPNNTMFTYVNGIRTDLGIISTQFASTITLDSIFNELQTRYFIGTLSVISLYNRSLTEFEIQQNVRALSGRYNLDTAIQPPPLTNSLINSLKVKADGEASTFDSAMISSSLADLNRINNLGLLESASLVITPATYKEGLIYNIKPRISTYNQAKFTQDFTTAGWAFTRISASYNYPDPFGANQSTLITVTGSGLVRMNQSIQLEPNIPYNVSWYVSQSNARYANIIFQDATEALMGATQIDFVSQSFYVRNGGAALSFNPRNLILESLPNSWYRASCTVTPTASIANRLFKTQVIPNTSSLGAYVSDISSSVYIYGVQVTKGETVLPYQRIVSASTPNTSYTRTTTCTAIDQNGYVSAFPYNLVANTNNALAAGGATVVRNALLAPDGTQTADIFTKTGNMAINQDVLLESVSPHSGSLYSLSFWTRLADTGSTLSMPVEIFTFSGSSGVTQIQPASYNITNEWQKVERTISLTGTLISYLSIRAARNSSATADNGRSFSIWGLQLTKGTSSLDTQTNFSRLNYPTIDYSAGTPAIRAVYSSENFFRWSNDLANPVWLKSGLIATTSSYLSPSDEYNTFTLTATASNASIKQSQASQNRVGLFSIWLRRKTGTTPIIISAGNYSSSLQLTTQWQRYQVGSLRMTGSFYTASSGAYTVTTSLPHGFEVGDFQGFGVGVDAFTQIDSPVTSVISPTSYTFTTGTTTASGSCTVSPRIGKIIIPQQGDEIDVWGPQLSGTDSSIIPFTSSFIYAKDFVPTTTTSVNRLNETISLNNLSSFIATNSTSGSFYIEFAYANTPNGFYTTFDQVGLFNTSGSKIFNLQASINNITGYTGYRWRYEPNLLFTTAPSSMGLLNMRKSVLVFTTNQMVLYHGGSIISTTNLTTPVNLSLDSISILGYMLIKSIIYFPHALNSSQAIALTT